MGLDAADTGVFVRFLSWLYAGRVPLLMLMVVFLAVYGLCGYLVQGMFQAASGNYLNGWVAAVAVWFLSLAPTRMTASVLYKIMPKDETSAIGSDELIGRVSTVVTGTARSGSPAQVRVKDVYGQQHYVMAEADGTDELPQGSAVLLVSRQGSLFKAIANPNTRGRNRRILRSRQTHRRKHCHRRPNLGHENHVARAA